MLTRIAGGDQQEGAERDVNAEDHLSCLLIVVATPSRSAPVSG